MADRYHHGDLRTATIARALEVIAADGPAAVTLRGLAADLGVSHTAPRHHFGDLRGLYTAIATDGFGLLADGLDAAADATRDLDRPHAFREVGVAYVEFALAHPSHFAVMFAPALLDMTDADLVAAERRAFARLSGGVDAMAAQGQVEDAAAAVIAGWSVVHGFATLALAGELDQAQLRPLVAGGDLLSIARRATGMLYGSPVSAPRSPHRKANP